MPFQFSNLPHEVMEMIVCLLDCRDICNLRLVSRAIDAASTQAHYKSFFVSKQVELDSTAIFKFAAIIQHSRFAGLLQHLKLTGPKSRQAPERFASADTDTLSTTFRSLCNLHKQSDQYVLRSLTAGVAQEAATSSGSVTRLGSRSAAGILAVRTALHVTNDSGVAIEKLHLLYNSLTCSVPICIFEDPFGSDQPYSDWSALRCLSLSLTQHMRPDVETGVNDADDDPEDPDPEVVMNDPEESSAAGTRRVQAMIDFFSLIPNIEELNLHWYGSRPSTPTLTPADTAEKHCFDKLFLAISFPKLKHLTLRGLHITQSSLQKVLLAPSLQQFHLEYTRLTGSLRPIIDILTSPNRILTQFYLDDIYEQRLVHFAIKGKPKFPHRGRVVGPSTVFRKGKEVTLPLEYGFAHGRSLGSPALANLIRRRKEDFGSL